MRLLFIALFVALPTVIFAQSNYHEGYVLKNNGDTLKGYIDYREWGKSPLSINFKTNKSDKQVLQFDPKTVRAFQITGMETYKSYAGNISMDKTRFPDLPDDLDTSKQMAAIFLKQIATGKHLTLYINSDTTKTRFFIAETSTLPVELKFHEYYNETMQMVSSTIFKGQLIFYINQFSAGNARLINKLKQAEYDEDSLVPIVDGINNNNVTTINKKSASRLFVGLAVNRTNTQVYNLSNSGVTQNSTTTTPKINLGIDIFDNPNVQRFAFRAELSFSYATPGFNSSVTVNDTKSSEVYSFNQYTVSLTPQILFNIYNKDNFKVYIDAGAAISFSSYSNNQLTIKDVETIKAPYKLEPFWTYFPLQAGITLNKKIEIYFSRSGYAGYTKYDNFSVSNQSYNLGVKFRIGKT